ncbi:MAG: thiosulfate sulfurtransferase [Coxiella sp. RIFCSPHIGHO2_12_FULL_42_15]|nr:MAG: thiosulfate sulfurtransferase [Coxiella sp. RIFCSPHIGHO2_12_FULL_42_15]
MYQQLTYQEAKELLHKTEVIVIDVRDQASYEAEHITGATHLSVAELNDFCKNTDSQTPILVYCYHGISSQSVAQYLIDQGFSKVYSLMGGFESWRSHHYTSGTKKT